MDKRERKEKKLVLHIISESNNIVVNKLSGGYLLSIRREIGNVFFGGSLNAVKKRIAQWLIVGKGGSDFKIWTSKATGTMKWHVGGKFYIQLKDNYGFRFIEAKKSASSMINWVLKTGF